MMKRQHFRVARPRYLPREARNVSTMALPRAPQWVGWAINAALIAWAFALFLTA